KIMNFNWREIMLPLLKNDSLTNFYLYRAPELFAEVKVPNIRSDIYSIGLIMHLLLNGKLPYEKGSNLIELYENVKEPKIIDNPDVSDDVKNMQRKLLAFSPKERYNQPFNLLNLLNNYLFMREELFDFEHKPVEIKRPVVSEETATVPEKPEKELEEIKSDIPEIKEMEKQPSEPVKNREEVISEEKEHTHEQNQEINTIMPEEHLETAELKDRYVDLLISYKRTITIAGFLFVLMVLLIVFFPDSIGGWLLGRF
ncbi:MAG: hypothetical protein JXR56_06630, partial [Candidatus Cloacimonetes bacterium]|nr:hypothetical protein [Candidatus Cloacimonadota bacterium]